jgi:SAM-dependent methyltransferase
MFFYAEDDVGLYDADAELNTPHYGSLQRFLVDLIRACLEAENRKERKLRSGVFLDIGSGTGAESIAILEAFPDFSVVAVDLCPPMHAIFIKKAQARLGPSSTDARVRTVRGDIADRKRCLPAIRQALSELSDAAHFDFVVSALTLHHLTTSEKPGVYQDICQLVKPHGIFLNADLFGYRSQQLDNIAFKNTLDWIQSQHDPRTTTFAEQLNALGDHASEIATKWIEHCKAYNITLPLEVRPRRRQAEKQKVGDNFDGELQNLLGAGFSEVGCPYRFWQTGVVWAQR